MFDLDTNIDVIEQHSSTDGLILVRVVEYHGIDKNLAMEKLPDMQRVMVENFDTCLPIRSIVLKMKVGAVPYGARKASLMAIVDFFLVNVNTHGLNTKIVCNPLQTMSI